MSTKSWNEYIIAAHEDMVKDQNTRELGKIRAAAAEYVALGWVNNHTGVEAVLRKTEKEVQVDKNDSGFDLYIPSTKTKIQVKYRAGVFHLATTRRHSEKNFGNASKTGHVAYKVDECDIFLFVIPNYDSMNPEDSEFIAIPSSALEDDKNPGFCVTTVPKKIISKFKGKAIEVLENTKRSS
jgi:hypothetical protein